MHLLMQELQEVEKQGLIVSQEFYDKIQAIAKEPGGDEFIKHVSALSNAYVQATIRGDQALLHTLLFQLTSIGWHVAKYNTATPEQEVDNLLKDLNLKVKEEKDK